MHAKINNSLVRMLCAASLLVIPISGAMADGTPMNGGMMGHGSWYGTGGGVWLPALAVIVLGAVLFAVLRKKN